ncbi:MAG: tRNA-uridine aminocarboxypropyltransferase [Planctomycetota bacterium]
MTEARYPTGIDDYTRVGRCRRCFFPPGLCVCDELQAVHVPFHVAVIRHRTEIALVSNTGRFVPRLLSDASLHELGLRDARFDGSWLQDPRRNTLVLFPQAGAEPLQPSMMDDLETATSRPLTLVLLDGTWSKARRMLRRVPELQTARRVALPLPRPQGLSPRKAPDPMAHCTLEAAAAAVTALGFTDAGAHLWENARRLIERIRHVQGRIRRPATDS